MLEEISLLQKQRMCYMHDGAPPHFLHVDRRHLAQAFNEQWNGREGPVVWPAPSTIMNPLDFWSWGPVHIRNGPNKVGFFGISQPSSYLRRLRVFENRILRRIFGPKRDYNGEWRRLHNHELHTLYRSPNVGRVVNIHYDDIYRVYQKGTTQTSGHIPHT